MKKIPLHDGIKVAKSVLRQIEQLLTVEDDLTSVWLAHYSNGREQGYLIHGHEISIAFSESRGSDYIVVYVGPSHTFNSGNVPSEAVFEAARRFGYDCQASAAKYIVRVLRKDLRAWLAPVRRFRKVVR
jgi:hypothetical protein